MPKKVYNKQVVEQVCILIEQGTISWTVISKAVGVGKRTLEEWRNRLSKHYKPDFVKAINKARVKLDCGETITGQLEASKKHKLKKVTRELQNTGPAMPKSWYTKSQIVRYAREVLKLRLNPKDRRSELLYACERKCEKKADFKMVKVKEEIQEAEPNQQAAKNVLTNCGPEDKRWNFGQDHVIDTSDPLTKLISEVAGIGNNLPSEEDK